jgi:DNA invertase Pin-like site-specific DNA recombinase
MRAAIVKSAQPHSEIRGNDLGWPPREGFQSQACLKNLGVRARLKFTRSQRYVDLNSDTVSKRGGEVLSVSEPDIDSDDPTRILVRQVLGAISQYERAMIRRRTSAGRAKKVAAGGYGGGRPKFGYKAEGGELIADEREQSVIAVVASLRARGRSLREDFCRDAEGVQPRTAGARWHSATVGTLLSS